VWADHDLAFPSLVGTSTHSQNVRSNMRPLAIECGFPGSFHSLQHIVASVVSSVPLPVVSKVLGHPKGNLTADLSDLP
jgi:hypothetical protein